MSSVFVWPAALAIAPIIQAGTLSPVERLLDEWQATAAIHADPELARRLRGPLPGDGAAVSRPG